MTKKPDVKSPMLSRKPWAKQAEEGAKIPSLLTQWKENRNDAAWRKSAINLKSKGKYDQPRLMSVSANSVIDLQVHA